MKKDLCLHPGIKGRGQQSDKSGRLQVKFDENILFFSQNRFSVNVVWLSAPVLAEGWDRKQQREVITVFMMRMLFLTLDNIPSRKSYWRNFSLVSISGRMKPLQAIGFISLMNTMNHVCLLSWTSEKHSVRGMAFPTEEAGLFPSLTPSHSSSTAFDFFHLLILFSFVTVNRFLLAYFK